MNTIEKEKAERNLLGSYFVASHELKEEYILAQEDIDKWYAEGIEKLNKKEKGEKKNGKSTTQ